MSAWKIVFHPEVDSEDLPSLPSSVRKAVLKAIHSKLAIDPEAYGKPLRKELFGFWKLRVASYRVIYQVQRKQIMVLIVKIGSRKDNQVYHEMLLRAKKFLIGG